MCLDFAETITHNDIKKLNDVEIRDKGNGQLEYVPTLRAAIKKGVNGVTVVTFHPLGRCPHTTSFNFTKSVFRQAVYN
jgi:hypothetical protein